MIRNSYLAKIIIEFHDTFEVEMLGYDPYKMKELAMDMEEKGISNGRCFSRCWQYVRANQKA